MRLNFWIFCRRVKNKVGIKKVAVLMPDGKWVRQGTLFDAPPVWRLFSFNRRVCGLCVLGREAINFFIG